MRDEKLRDLFLNWKGLEFIHSLKSISKLVITMLSIIFIIISLKIQNYYVLAASLILFFLQILSENNKEYYLKYKEIFENVYKGNRHQTYKSWIDFLEKTRGLTSIYKWFFGLFFNKKFEEEMKKI